jgi:hypothetical protein
VVQVVQQTLVAVAVQVVYLHHLQLYIQVQLM